MFKRTFNNFVNFKKLISIKKLILNRLMIINLGQAKIIRKIELR